ncbi:hypothetical protein [Sphaerospermopsis sp. LEGE 00249]|nr:hypothetical protein [Sphaerospermopsis sp. LEGE 00249]
MIENYILFNQLPITNYQLPITNHQSPITNFVVYSAMRVFFML